MHRENPNPNHPLSNAPYRVVSNREFPSHNRHRFVYAFGRWTCVNMSHAISALFLAITNGRTYSNNRGNDNRVSLERLGTQNMAKNATPLAPISQRAMPIPIEGLDASEVQELVTRPTLSHEQGKVVQLRFLSILQHKDKLNKKTGELERGPDVAIVVDRHTGMESMYVCNAITASELQEKYPDGGYVGKCFAIQKLKPTKGQYCEINIVRLRDELF